MGNMTPFACEPLSKERAEENWENVIEFIVRAMESEEVEEDRDK